MEQNVDDKDFQPMLMNTLKLEGGYNAQENSNFGVKQDVYDAFAKANKLPSKSVKELNFGEVSNFYKKDYYDKVKDLPTKELKGLVFDYAVNAGAGTAISALQEVVGSKVDGIMGGKTKQAVDKYIAKNGEDTLHAQLIQKRVDHYASLIQQDPMKYGQYEKGWLNRMNSLMQMYKSNSM